MTHITKEGLLPCPFCGGKAFADQVCAPASLPVQIAGCEVCGCTTRLRVWNMRAAELSAQESKPVDLVAAWVNLKFIMRVLQAGNEATVKDKADAYWMCKELLELTHATALSAQESSPSEQSW